MLTCEQSIQLDRDKAEAAAHEAMRGKTETDNCYIREAHVRALLDYIEDLRWKVGSLKNDLDDALEAVRLHEQQAHERHDVTEELEWRIRGNRLAAAAAM